MFLRLIRFSAVLVIASLMAGGVAWYFVWGDSMVRPLAMKGFGDRLPVPNHVTVFASSEELGRLAGLNSAALAAMDFAEHD